MDKRVRSSCCLSTRDQPEKSRSYFEIQRTNKNTWFTRDMRFTQFTWEKLSTQSLRSERVRACRKKNKWLYSWVNAWVNTWVNACVNIWVNAWVNTVERSGMNTRERVEWSEADFKNALVNWLHSQNSNNLIDRTTKINLAQLHICTQYTLHFGAMKD